MEYFDEPIIAAYMHISRRATFDEEINNIRGVQLCVSFLGLPSASSVLCNNNTMEVKVNPEREDEQPKYRLISSDWSC